VREDVHSVLRAQGQVLRQSSGRVLMYGTSDPVPNIGELILTMLVAEKNEMRPLFLVYQQGTNRYVAASLADSARVATRNGDWLNEVARWLGIRPEIRSLTEVLPAAIWDKHLNSIVARMRTLRPGDRFMVMRSESETWYCDDADVTNSQDSLGTWHGLGAWMSGALIHYCLAVLSVSRLDVVHLAPWNEKGRVYEMYKGSPAQFVLSPWLGIAPPSSLPKQWGLSLHPEVFGGLLRDCWNEDTRTRARAVLENWIFFRRLNRKVFAEASEGGLWVK